MSAFYSSIEPLVSVVGISPNTGRPFRDWPASESFTDRDDHNKPFG